MARSTLRLYKSYMFKDKDPVIDEVRTAIEDVGVTYAFIEQKSGVTDQTLRNWFHGPTKRPQHATVRAVLRAIGYDYKLVKIGHENVVPLRSKGHAKAGGR